MSTLLEQVLTTAYVNKYRQTYDRAIADGHGADHASHEASKAAWAARARTRAPRGAERVTPPRGISNDHAGNSAARHHRRLHHGKRTGPTVGKQTRRYEIHAGTETPDSSVDGQRARTT